MKHFVRTDAQGLVLEIFRGTDIHAHDLTEITEQDFDAVRAGGLFRLQGKQLAAVYPPKITKAEKLAQAKQEALLAIEHVHAETIHGWVNQPTQAEKDTWALKLEIANTIINKGVISQIDQAFLDSAGLISNAAKTAWAESVHAKSVAYRQAVGVSEKLRKTAKRAILSSKTVETVNTALHTQRIAAQVPLSKRSRRAPKEA